MPGTRAILGALSAVVCAAVLAACGDDEPGTIPDAAGDALLAQLDEIEESVQRGDCDAANAAALALAQDVSDLPEEVDEELRNRLVEASANLESLTEDPGQCEVIGASGETDTVPETEATTTTETTETTTEPEEQPEDEGDEDEGPPAEPPGQSGGNQGGGNAGGGQGSGGGDEGSGGIGSDGD